MIFCGMLDNKTGRADFTTLKKMRGLHREGCAFIDGEYGILCDGLDTITGEGIQPITVKHNNALYTAAISCDTYIGECAATARGVLEGYIEEGEGYLRGLDFPYALALYDGRCGELMLVTGERGKPLFYSIIDGTVYFSTTLRSIMRLFGGCVRVRKNVLLEHIFGVSGQLPEMLFCDIKPLRNGKELLCSRLGESLLDAPLGIYTGRNRGDIHIETLKITQLTDIRKSLMEALFTFEYPQFDAFMPYVLSLAIQGKNERVRSLSFYDGLDVPREYSVKRAEYIGSAYGLELTSVAPERDKRNTRVLKAMERDLDGILSEYLDKQFCVLHKLVNTDDIKAIDNEKSITSRIRKKGMLCQSAMWFECYNLVLV